jgi:hypothetical protein
MAGRDADGRKAGLADSGSRDRRSWRRRGGCPTCCAHHTVPGHKSEAPSDGSFAVLAARRRAVPATGSSLACAAGLDGRKAGLADSGSRDRRSWRRRGGCPTCCAHHTVPGDKSEAPSDGSFAVLAARRRAVPVTGSSLACAAGLDGRKAGLDGRRARGAISYRWRCPGSSSDSPMASRSSASRQTSFDSNSRWIAAR